jgi:hypothetical protein
LDGINQIITGKKAVIAISVFEGLGEAQLIGKGI